ncbi:uncharacterized protein B0H64DRAFT_1795 [Chaetomium fimeti]|uniref:Uncharacterized protein n=1 Tax=Chaetomium fimeti TaxID=1854472 RepID=A0AAE0LW75_9PEZI|nr:hypothetical protein B0H64DRAFT_1795 [Chaetomium fimeti]
MPNLVAIDVSVTDDRIRLVFSDRAVAAAYAAYLRAQDLRPPQYQTIPGYQRSPQLHTTTKEVSLSLPNFITWFITCRLPDDEDAVTFTFMDEHEAHAARWADAMLLFEPAPTPRPRAASTSSTAVGDEDDDGYYYDDDHHNKSSSLHDSFHSHSHSHHDHTSSSMSSSPVKQLHVRRLWNRARLLKRLEELRRRTPTVRSRVGSPVWAANGGIVHGYGANGGRMPVGITVPGVQRGDIWW